MNDYEMHHLAVLNRIALALETIAMSNAPAPNFAKPIEAYATFDPATIGAVGKERDAQGWTSLEWGGYLWTRRSPQNKFGEAIWFSRPVGKNADDGSVKYARLITFKRFAEAEPLPRKVEALVDASKKPDATQPTEPEPTIDQFLGPNPRQPQPAEQAEKWPTNKAEFEAWMTAHGYNGKTTHQTFGTDVPTWLKQNPGKTWADAAKAVAATIGK